jgi:hypothetical protein
MRAGSHELNITRLTAHDVLRKCVRFSIHRIQGERIQNLNNSCYGIWTSTMIALSALCSVTENFSHERAAIAMYGVPEMSNLFF